MNSKDVKNKNDILPGQISVFDIAKVAKNSDSSKMEINKELAVDSPFTLNQLIAYKKYRASGNVLRVIRYYCGYIGIEITNSDLIVTHVIERQGIEYSFSGRAGVLPWDKIIFNSDEVIYTSVQIKRLNTILDKDTNKIKRVIKRKGDLNILIQEVNKVISILPNGWVLEFEKTILIEYQIDEIFNVNACGGI